MARLTKDIRWLIAWGGGMLVLAVWDMLFLNRPALRQVAAGFADTFIIALMVIVFSLAFGWAIAISLHFLEVRKQRAGYLVVTFVLNVVRSVPQIVGVLFGYVFVSFLLQRELVRGAFFIFVIMALVISVFICVEVVDLMRERIAFFRTRDFYDAMLVCGIPEGRIVNFDILWKNSRIHIFNKLIAVFGMAVFLQCSVDFIISVGLSTTVAAVNLPLTLGSLLANIDSKQDILAISTTFTNPGYLPNLFFEHLQGVTVAFVIVFTLLCVYNISNGFAEKNRL